MGVGSDPPDESPPNPMAGLSDSWAETREDRTRLERLIEVATTLHEGTRVSDVADRAGCSANFAADKLDLLVGLGVLEKASENPAEYRRDEMHFRRLRTRSLVAEYDGDVEAAIEAYRERDADLQEQFGVESPDAVTWELLDGIDEPDELAAAKDALSTWVVVRRRLLDLQRAATLEAANDESTDPFDTLADIDEHDDGPVEMGL